jgi:hypothetical protein
MQFFEDELDADERWRLTLDPRLHRPPVRSNKEWLRDLAQFRQYRSEMVEVHDKLIHSSKVLFHDEGTTVGELQKILQYNRVSNDVINQLTDFLINRSKFVVMVKDPDGIERLYLRPKQDPPQGRCEWISQLNYL